VTVAGDSAAGGLALSLLLSLGSEGLPMPGAVVLLCPSVDLSGTTLADAAADDPSGEPIAELAKRVAAAYLAGHPIDDPVVSPLKADLTGLPPMLVQAATGDPVRPDAELLTERARAHGVDVRLELYPGTTHAFQMFWTFLPDGADALQAAGAFIREQTRTARRVAPAAGA
jgi:monoterpene epsilon-lactone hydrolase